MPIILATWEAVIGKIVVSGQPGQKSSQDPMSMEENLGVVLCSWSSQ
jgi:hypothetical protein